MKGNDVTILSAVTPNKLSALSPSGWRVDIECPEMELGEVTQAVVAEKQSGS